MSGETPALRRRLFSLIYEGVLLFGVVFIAAYLYSALTQFRGHSATPLYYGFQFAIFVAIGLYFVLCWRTSGQTLPMKTWKLRLASTIGTRPSLARCWGRYAFAWIGPLSGLVAYKSIVLLSSVGMSRFSPTAFLLCLPFFALNFLWALGDRDRQFLHDRLAGTRLVTV